MNTLQSYVNELRPEGAVFRAVVPDLRAEFAMRMVVEMGLIAAKPALDGSPRDKFPPLQTPTEIVDRANQIASYAFDEFERLGWLTHCPVPTPRERQRPPNSRSAISGIDGEEKQNS